MSIKKTKPSKPCAFTMAGMAGELGLSRAAVSAAVNGGHSGVRLSAGTIKRIREQLAMRGYVPSRAACNLRENPARVVGILHVNSFNTHLIEAFHRIAREFVGHDPAIETMMTKWNRLKPAVQELLSRRVTDLVWIHNSSAGEEYRDPEIAPYLSNMRTVIYNYWFDSPLGEKDLLARGISLVGVDRLTHTHRLARFLRRLGHRIVAFPEIMRGVQRPYCEAFESAGLTIADCPPPFSVEGMRKAMKEQGVTAACFHGDSPACLALCALRAAGIRVPEDLTVTGFDGSARFYNSELTTLAMPVEKMVAKVCEIVRGTERVQRHCFDLELVKGLTHGPAAVKRGEGRGEVNSEQ